MKNTMYAATMLSLTLAFTACSKDSKNKSPEAPVTEKAVSESLTIDPGTYTVSIGCAEEEKTAALPKTYISYVFNEDGSYIESIQSLDQECETNCESTNPGTYQATKTNFTFLRRFPAVSDGSYAKEVVQSEEFAVVESVPEKGQIVLWNESPENLCGGPLTWTMTKHQPSP